MTDEQYLRKLIEEGEHDQQDVADACSLACATTAILVA